MTPMILALLVTTLGSAPRAAPRGAPSPPLIYGAYYAGTLFALYLGVRLILPHSDVLLLPLVTLLTGLGLVMIFRLTYNVDGKEGLAITQAVWILIGSGAMVLLVLVFRNYHRPLRHKDHPAPPRLPGPAAPPPRFSSWSCFPPPPPASAPTSTSPPPSPSCSSPPRSRPSA